MIYPYQCNSCGAEAHHANFSPIGGHLDLPCQCCGGLMVRRASFQFRRSMAAHFNQSTGTYVSNEREFADGLKLASEEASARTGMDHNFIPVDVTDMKALGVTDEGLEHTKKVRRDTGLDAPSTTKVII
jgi:hypothetical protein